jgi:hypothetical protein
LNPLRSKSADNSRINRLHHTTDGVAAAGDSALPSDLPPPHKSLISEQLIKDQQKFLQRKKEVHDRELAKQAEEEAYEKMVLTHSLTHSLTHLLTYLLTYSLTYSLTYLLTYSLTHSRIVTRETA